MRGAADGFFHAPAGELSEAFVNFDVAPGADLSDGDGVGAGVKRLGKLSLRSTQCTLGGLAVGGVVKGSEDARLPIDGEKARRHLAEYGVPVGMQKFARVVFQ